MAKRRGRNEGTIWKERNTWRAQVFINHERISFSAQTKAECQAWTRKMLDQLAQGYDYKGGRITLGNYLRQWLETCKVALRPQTVHQYGLMIKNHIEPYLGDTPLKDLRTLEIEQLYVKLLDKGAGVRTVRYTHSVLHRALEKAVGYGLLMQNPSSGATLPRLRQPEMQVLDESQVTQLLIAATGSAYEAVYHLAITTGMRQGELFGLRWSDLQWNSGTLNVQRQVQRGVGKGWTFSEPKTRSGRRQIKLGEGTLEVLRRQRDRQHIRKEFAGARWHENDLIFTSSVGTPLDPSNLRQDFLKVLESARLPKIRFHDLRHTAASLMLNHGVPVIVVSKMLGHAKPSITLDIYGHLYQEMQSEAARIMDELVTPIQIELTQESKQNTLK